MPPNIESFSLTYRYERHHENEIHVENGSFISRQEINIIDLVSSPPMGLKWSIRSDKTEITISENPCHPATGPGL